MKRGSLIAANLLVASALQLGSGSAAPQEKPAAIFRSSVDVVRVSAVVRDGKGRFVKNLRASDFEVFDAGLPRPIAEFRQDIGGVSVALLFDVSGSMEARVADAHDAARHVLSWLDGSDEAAVFTFDTQLDEVTPFTAGLRALPEILGSITPFGATSVNDAIARTAERMKDRQGRRRAVVVFTDGNDNASRLKPEEVSATASAIDVPVYIFGVVSTVDNPTSEAGRDTAKQSPLAGPLMDLAAWTGGHVFVSSTPADRSASARQVVDELRHQYLIAFESSGRPGWHPLEVRARGKDLVVRARSGYVAGQSRPVL
jgi:Ca-activated chloride channel family protein